MIIACKIDGESKNGAEIENALSQRYNLREDFEIYHLNIGYVTRKECVDFIKTEYLKDSIYLKTTEYTIEVGLDDRLANLNRDEIFCYGHVKVDLKEKIKSMAVYAVKNWPDAVTYKSDVSNLLKAEGIISNGVPITKKNHMDLVAIAGQSRSRYKVKDSLLTISNNL
jgi:hypothetical protein